MPSSNYGVFRILGIMSSSFSQLAAKNAKTNTNKEKKFTFIITILWFKKIRYLWFFRKDIVGLMGNKIQENEVRYWERALS
jgi:hypothetical protein